MGGQRSLIVARGNNDVVFSSSGIKLHQIGQESRNSSRSCVFFASVNQGGMGLGISPNPTNPLETSTNLPYSNLNSMFVTVPEKGYLVDKNSTLALGKTLEELEKEKVVETNVKKKKGGFRLKIKIGNSSLRKLLSGGIAGAVSRTAVAPLETVRTHLMVGSCGNSATEVFQNIMKNEGWKGLFAGNLVNVIRVAPSKAIELFAYETIKKHLTPKPGQFPIIPIPPSSIAGAAAGITSTLLTYPLELLKTRLTVQRGVYKNLADALVTIIREEGPSELYRGLTPSLIGVIPYAAANYFAYDTLRVLYKKTFKKEEVGSLATLLIGSAAGAISSSVTFPLEVARKHMQAGALNGRQYHNMLHALVSIMEKEGVEGLFRGLGPSCLKLVPAAGISFMCYEACKRVLVENEESS